MCVSRIIFTRLDVVYVVHMTEKIGQVTFLWLEICMLNLLDTCGAASMAKEETLASRRESGQQIKRWGQF